MDAPRGETPRECNCTSLEAPWQNNRNMKRIAKVGRHLQGKQVYLLLIVLLRKGVALVCLSKKKEEKVMLHF